MAIGFEIVITPPSFSAVGSLNFISEMKLKGACDWESKKKIQNLIKQKQLIQ
jgi:hypothetical protein